jgi:hypothetical protein
MSNALHRNSPITVMFLNGVGDEHGLQQTPCAPALMLLSECSELHCTLAPSPSDDLPLLS